MKAASASPYKTHTKVRRIKQKIQCENKNSKQNDTYRNRSNT